MSPLADGTKKMSMRLSLALLGIGAVIVLGYSLLFGTLIYPFTPDSSVYIEVAHNLLAGHGLVLTPAPSQHALEYVPLQMFPPGYPLLIALISALGLPPVDVALWLARISWMLLPLAAVFCLRPVMTTKGATVVAIMMTLSPGMIDIGYRALSDAPFLLLTVVSFGLLLRSLGECWSFWRVLLAGVAIGLAYSLRNAGVAVIIAVVATFVLAAVLQLFPLRDAFLRLVWWGTGVALLVVPQWVWNFAVFGRLQIYTMPPSDIGLLENIRTFLQALLVDVSGSSTIGLLAWDAKLFALVSLGFGVIVYVGLKARWREWGTAEKFSVMLFTLYLIAGSAMVVLARTIYQWGELINLRHVVQYSWLVMAMFTMVTVERVGLINHKMLAIIVIVVGLLFTGRVSYWNEKWQRETLVQKWLICEARPERVAAKLPDSSWVMSNQLRYMLSMNETLARQVRQLPDKAYLISNSADVLKIATGRAIRDLDSATPRETQRLLEDLLHHIDKNKPIYVLLFPNDRMLKEAPEQGWASEYLNHLPQGFSVACHAPMLLLLARDFGHPHYTCQELARTPRIVGLESPV